MWKRIKSEPVLISGLVRAAIVCLTAFGLDLSADQVAGVMLVTEAVLALVTRATVSPVTDITEVDPEPDAVEQ